MTSGDIPSLLELESGERKQNADLSCGAADCPLDGRPAANFPMNTSSSAQDAILQKQVGVSFQCGYFYSHFLMNTRSSAQDAISEVSVADIVVNTQSYCCENAFIWSTK